MLIKICIPSGKWVWSEANLLVPGCYNGYECEIKTNTFDAVSVIINTIGTGINVET